MYGEGSHAALVGLNGEVGLALPPHVQQLNVPPDRCAYKLQQRRARLRFEDIMVWTRLRL
jgi:hypothetical protein